MLVDYIIVGAGLAGMSFAEKLIENNKKFVVFEDRSQCSSLVAGGMYNPVILKRFTPVWNAKEQLQFAGLFYPKLEDKFGRCYDQAINIKRIFKSVEEQNNWLIAGDHPALKEYMVPAIEPVDNKAVIAPYKAGRLINTGRIKVADLLRDYRKMLKDQHALVEETFIYDNVITWNDRIEYKDIRAQKIVFCEGNGLRFNPFFKDLPLNGTKGELISIYAPDLEVEEVIKSAVFIMPLGNDQYKIGATFNWSDKSNTPTPEGREELETKLKKVIRCNYEVIDHEAGVRPTTGDRRPLLGCHEQNNRLVVFNGLGTRGVMVAPLMASKLYNFLAHDQPLDKEISIERFKPHQH